MFKKSLSQTFETRWTELDTIAAWAISSRRLRGMGDVKFK